MRDSIFRWEAIVIQNKVSGKVVVFRDRETNKQTKPYKIGAGDRICDLRKKVGLIELIER